CFNEQDSFQLSSLFRDLALVGPSATGGCPYIFTITHYAEISRSDIAALDTLLLGCRMTGWFGWCGVPKEGDDRFLGWWWVPKEGEDGLVLWDQVLPFDEALCEKGGAFKDLGKEQKQMSRALSAVRVFRSSDLDRKGEGAMAKAKKQKGLKEESQETRKVQTEGAEAEEAQKPVSAEASEAKAEAEEDPKSASAEVSEAEEDEEPAQEAKEALEVLLPEICRLKKAEVEQVRLSGGRVSGYAQRVEVLYQDALSGLRKHFKILPEGELGQLRVAALAFWRARRDVALIDPRSQTLRKRYEEAGELKGRVVDVLKVVGRGDADVQRVLEEVRPGAGYEDRADDLKDLHSAVKRYRSVLLKKELLTEEEMDAMPRLAESLLAPSKEKAALEKARLLRDQAWTYFVRIQREMARYLRFIYDGQPEVLAQIELHATTPTTSAKKASNKSGKGQAKKQKDAKASEKPANPTDPNHPTPDAN
ncbi:hypothetical protein L6R29_20455, partial [Myxococcota bacterium]|nr:hypothetical protein [Myxococcota bacterium]